MNAEARSMDAKTRSWNAKIAKNSKSKQRGFTLVECLAIVALMALTVGTVAVGVAPSADAARLRDARSSVLGVDAKARVLARRGEPVLLMIEDGTVRAALAGTDYHRPVFERQLVGVTEVSLLEPTTRQPLAGVRVDSAGQSEDYLIRLRVADRRSVTLVAGLTGYAFRAEELSLAELALEEYVRVGTTP